MQPPLPRTHGTRRSDRDSGAAQRGQEHHAYHRQSAHPVVQLHRPSLRATAKGNEDTQQLAIIATVFLPLGYFTGFSSQNFAWPITHMQVGLGYFLVFGLGSELVAIVLLLVLFKRRGWLGSGPTA